MPKNETDRPDVTTENPSRRYGKAIVPPKGKAVEIPIWGGRSNVIVVHPLTKFKVPPFGSRIR